MAGKVCRGRPEDPPQAMFVAPPMHSYMEQPEDMRILQQQNDALARHIQALEHAKSLAAVQSAQALHRIRTRQEQLKREANHAVQKAKLLQAEAPGTPTGSAR